MAPVEFRQTKQVGLSQYNRKVVMGIGLLLVLIWLMPGWAGAASPLKSYHIDRNQVSVSGLSSGGFMAVQMHVAFSKTFMGAGVLAGGPFLCAENSPSDATGRCMKSSSASLPTPEYFKDLTLAEATAGRIDSTDNLSTDKIWLLTGGADDLVLTRVMDTLKGYYGLFTSEENIAYQRNTLANAHHAMITENYGNECGHFGSPYINDCDYSAAKELLHHIYGSLNPSVTAPHDNLKTFDQSEFTGSENMDVEGYIYVPTVCADGAVPCRLHVAFHGCFQNRDKLGDRYARHSGYNEWAESNRIIVLYPQTGTKATNQCWDWWGYGESGSKNSYATKDGAQLRSVKAMLDRIMGREPNLYCGEDTNANHLAANRAHRWFFWYTFANGSSDYLGMSSSGKRTLREEKPGYYVKVDACP